MLQEALICGPVPYPSGVGRAHHDCRAQLLQSVVVATLNWECLGHPVKPPPSACAGYKYSDAQLDMLDRLERLIDHFLQAGPLSSHELGRSGEKFNHLLRAAKELPEFPIPISN